MFLALSFLYSSDHFMLFIVQVRTEQYLIMISRLGVISLYISFLTGLKNKKMSSSHTYMAFLF